GFVQLGLVTVGAAAGFVPGYLVERARWQRETAAEWRQIRRDNIRSFMTLMSRLTHETIMLGEALRQEPLPGDPGPFVLITPPTRPPPPPAPRASTSCATPSPPSSRS